MSWNTEFFNRETKEKKEPVWGEYDYAKQQEAYNWDYFNIPGGKLGNREIKYNRNLLNEDEFARFWQSGKKANYKIYKGYDLDGDHLPDMIATDPNDRVVGFNERYVTEEGKGETPYRREYYSKPKDARKGQTYMEYLDGVNTQQGWRDISKIKQNRSTATWKVIFTYLDSNGGLSGLQATEAEKEQMCKQLVKVISWAFFPAENTPKYMFEAVTASAEFKKVLKKNVHNGTIHEFIPKDAIPTVINGMLQYIRGYGGNVVNQLMSWLKTNCTKYRIRQEDLNKLYSDILTKQAANKIYRQHGITALQAAENDELMNQYKAAINTKKQELHTKYANQDYKIGN